VPYKGGIQAIQDTIGGQTQVLMNGMLATLPHVQSGKLKVLGVSKKTRMPLIGDVPTIAEQGVPGFESGTWQGVLVPKGTPEAIVQKLNTELIKAIRNADVRARLAGQGAEVVTMTAAEQDRSSPRSAGGPTRFAIQCAQAAEKAGAHGILLLPHYLTEAGQEGLAAHVEAVCKSVKFGVIVYNRASSRLKPETLAGLAERNPNLVGFKDGIGDIEAMVAIYQRMGDRFAYLGGLPTAEVYAAAYKAMGTPVYSSAVFNFIPKTAVDFYKAVAADDLKTQHHLLKTFFMPYLELRNRVPGYAVSIVKAGAKIVGHDAGPVRAPLTDLKPAEMEQLKALIDALGPQ
jgi:5-dehydro-4-deoxyglucarate dehydratase